MQTFRQAKPFTDDPDYRKRRSAAIAELDISVIDPPIREIVSAYNTLTYSFSLQSCYGHFLYEGEGDDNNTDPLPEDTRIEKVDYRIAYLAFCVENSEQGRSLKREIADLTRIDPMNIQLGSAGWVWKDIPNFYAIQVEPDRHRDKDRVFLDFEEALRIERVRNEFFASLADIVFRRAVEVNPE